MIRRSSVVVVALVSIVTIATFAACSDEDDPAAVTVDGGAEGDAPGSADGSADARTDGALDARTDATLDARVDAPWDGVSVACSRALGDGSDHVIATAVAYDPKGYIVVTGRLNGTVDFGGGPLSSAGDADVFVVKLDGRCEHVWSKRFGASLDQVGLGVGTDSTGNVYVGGVYRGALDFGAGPLPSAGSSEYNIFVAKLTSSGGTTWARAFGDVGDQQLTSMAVAPDGAITIGGLYNGAVDFGGGPLSGRAPGDGGDAFVTRLDQNGSHVWSRGFGPPASATAGRSGVGGLALLSGGDVIVSGGATDAVDFGDGSFDFGAHGFWLLRMATNGSLAWSRKIRDARGGPVAVDAAGALFVAAVIYGPADFGTGPLLVGSGPSHRTGAVARFEADGTGATWVRAMGQSDPPRTVSFRGAAATTERAEFSLLCTGTENFGGGPVACGASRLLGVSYAADGGLTAVADQPVGDIDIANDGRTVRAGVLPLAGMASRSEVSQTLK